MEKIKSICKILEKEYGRPRWKREGNLLDELIATILSQNTTSKQALKAFETLKERFGTWDVLRNKAVSEVADAIRCGGLAECKARRILSVLNEIYARHGSLDIDWLANIPEKEAIEYLQSFEGVGPKTAACVLMFGLGKPVMPVDTHVYRVATRLGIINRVGNRKAHDALQRIIPPDMVYSYHVNLVLHGRLICKAINPRCDNCALRYYCETFRLQNGEMTNGKSQGTR
ncbi:MAG: endonuclease III domain-containing protein [Armatimonadota bacterium]